MEAALDEERKSVLALLEGSTHPTRAQRGSASSADSGGRTSSPFRTTPRSPVRSMLDISEDPAPPRHSSIAGTNNGITSPPRTGLIRSMLDINGPPVPQSTRSAQTSPTETHHKNRSLNNLHPRSMSDTTGRPADFGLRAAPERSSKGDLTSEYQFSGILPSNPGGIIVPKRNTLAGKGAMADVVRGTELGSSLGRDRGRNSIASTGIGNNSGSKSRSPHNRLGLRSNSPHASLLNTNSSNLLNNPGKFALDNGVVVDMNSAYRRLSDANLALAGGSLAGLGKSRRRTDSGDNLAAEGARLVKDYSYEEDDAVAESSDEDHSHSSDEERNRGRKKADGDEEDLEGSTIGMGRAKGPRQALSQMAAAEEEREYRYIFIDSTKLTHCSGQQIAQQQQRKYKVRSLLEPEIMVTGPGGDRIKNVKPGIHPTTAFDQGGSSGLNTPLDSDTEADITDIRRAQKLAVLMTPISSTPETNRCVRTIYRGDFAEMQKEASENHRRVRKYLVATDLSDEAAHALEWTVGTVLRDGDTLLAIYCVDEETGIQRPEGEAPLDSEATMLAATIAATTNKSQAQPGPTAVPVHEHRPSPLRGLNSITPSPVGRARSYAEQERYKAVQDITDRVTRLLRKTRLQVRVVIEVIHCKSPKHLICEVIDYISPTLVILGSRGRSALKGSVRKPIIGFSEVTKAVPSLVKEAVILCISFILPSLSALSEMIPPKYQINLQSNLSAH